MGFRNPIVIADEVTSGTFAGTYTIGGLMVVGNPNASHVAIGTDTHGADGVRLYSSDGVTPLIDLNIAGTPTITGALIRTAATGQRVELTATAASLVNFYSGNALETAPGTIGSQVLAGTLYTTVAGPKAGTMTNPPQLQLYNTGTSQAAVLQSPQGVASLQSNGWAMNWDATGTHNTLAIPGAILLRQEFNSTAARELEFLDQGGASQGQISLAGGAGWYTPDATLNDFIVHAQARRLLLNTTNYSNSCVILDANTGVLHHHAATSGDGALQAEFLADGDDGAFIIGKSGSFRGQLSQITLPGAWAASTLAGDFLIRTGGSAGRLNVTNSNGAYAPVLASAFTVTSTRASKTNVVPLDAGLAEVRRLRPITYRYRDELAGDTRAGLIAEELADVFAPAVHFSPATGLPAGIDYGALAPLLIRAIQQLADDVATRPRSSLIALDAAA